MMKKLKFLGLISIFSANILGTNDPLFQDQWGVKNTGQAIVTDTGSLSAESVPGVPGRDIDYIDLSSFHIPSDRKVVVAVLDTGLDVTHPDLKGRIWVNEEIHESCLKEEKPSYCFGFNMLKLTPNVEDDLGHGTHVAGIIAATANNGIGVAGVADSKVLVMPIKVLSNDTNKFVYPVKMQDGSTSKRLMSDIFALGIRQAIVRGAQVINMSLGWPKAVEGELFKKALALAQEHNVPIVVAAGNNNKKVTTFPCNYKGVICVGANDNRGLLAEQSNYGSNVDISAPGVSIISTHPLNIESKITRIKGYEKKTGTSQAAPMVSAIVANMKLINPDISVDEIKARLYSSAVQDDLIDRKYTLFGRVSMKKALLEKPATFVAPIVKDIKEIPFSKQTGVFQFTIPVKSYVSDAKSVRVQIIGDLKGIELEQRNFTISQIKKGQEKNLEIKGRVTDLLADSDFEIQIITTASSSSVQKSKLSLVLTRDIGKESDLNSIVIENTKGEDLIRKAIPLDRLKVSLVQNFSKDSTYPEFFSYSYNEDNIELSVYRFENGVYKNVKTSFDVKVPSNVVSVYKNDFNFDGKDDYLFFLENKRKGELDPSEADEVQPYHAFIYVDHKLNPLFGQKSLWEIPDETFIDLPKERVFDEKSENELNGVDEKLNWLKVHDSNFGDILVPGIFGIGPTPDADNSDDFLDNKPDTFFEFHLFYYRPKISGSQVEAETRVVDSMSFYQNIQTQLHLNSNDGIQVERPFEQDQKERSEGTLSFPISVGNSEVKNFYLIELDEVESYRLKFADSQNLALNNNFISSIASTGNAKRQSSFSSYIFPIDKDKVRVAVFDKKMNFVEEKTVTTHNWSDVIFKYVYGYQEEDSFVHFVFSRYYIHMFGDDGVHGKLRINLDSTMESDRFKESIYPSFTNVSGKFRPSLFIDGTAIYGDRIYSMVKLGPEFIRPRVFSIKMDEDCLQFNKSLLFGGEESYVMLCGKGENQAYIKAVPLKF